MVLVAAVLGLGLIGIGGTVVDAAEPRFRPSRIPLVGRTTTICTVTAPTSGDPTTRVAAVVSRQAPGRAGELTGTPLAGGKPSLTIKEQGKATELTGVEEPVLMAGEGVMATASSAAVFNLATEGVDAGLSAAPCLAPGTTHWFTGLGGTDTDRTDLVLTNADDADASVDLRFYGPDGRVVVPGSPGLAVEAQSTTTVSLSNLVDVDGPLAVAIQSSRGRVSAVAKRTRASGVRPIGADWQLPSLPPALSMAIPAVPEDDGARELVVTNPGPVRASVNVSILGLQGPYAPSGAETLEVGAESSATVDLAEGLAGEAATIKLTSDQPVTGAVVSSSRRSGAQADIAIQSAAAPLVRTGVSALATTRAGEGELMLSNTGTKDASVSFEVLSFDGVVLRTDDVLLGPDSTATRRLNSPPPSYVVVRVPEGSAVVGGVVLTQAEGEVAGLATIPLTSPDVASRAPRTQLDPAVGR
ncbi:MAG TPA: DUF5719 family protein [Propionibacteriaceae bacterium]|nr:DUF5719 family protein [Propionibacteriaceae bacterium]